VIHPADLAALAELYDRFANAIERLSSDRLQARRQFVARLETLYQQEGGGIDFETFRYEAVKRCKEYLKKN
jgi:hypothetical protein